MGIIDLELLNNYFVAESPPRDSVLLKAVAFFFAELLVSRTLRERKHLDQNWGEELETDQGKCHYQMVEALQPPASPILSRSQMDQRHGRIFTE